MRDALSTNRGLHSLYNRMMERIIKPNTDTSRNAIEALTWLAFASKSFTVKQLQQAISIQMSSDDLNPDDLPFTENISEICGGLLVIDQAHEHVSLIHYSLREYLQDYLQEARSSLPLPNVPQTLIAKKCLTCLLFKPFALVDVIDVADLGDRLERYAMLRYAASHWGEHAREVPLEDILDEILSFFNSQNNLASAALIMSISEKHSNHYEQAYRGMRGLHISAFFGLSNLVEHLLVSRKISPDIVTHGDWTALHWAARRGHVSTVSCLVRHQASVEKVTQLDGWNALHLAAKEGKYDVIQTLMLETKLDLDAKDHQSRTALFLATWGGHTEIVLHLLQNGADPNIRTSYGATALHCAAKRGRLHILNHLINFNAEINAEDAVGLTALQEAARKQNSTIIEALVGAGATAESSRGIHHDDYILGDLDWETYTVNKEDTMQIKNGNQCVCHVLEKYGDTAEHTVVSSTYVSACFFIICIIRSSVGSVLKRPQKVFRKTYTLSTDINGKMRKYFQSERQILERLRHPNVVTYLDFDEDPDQNAFLLYTEYCDLGDLKAHYCRRFDEEDVDDEEEEEISYGFYSQDLPTDNVDLEALTGPQFWSVVFQITSAISYLHYGLAVKKVDDKWSAYFERSWIKVIHRDVKPANSEFSDGSISTSTLINDSRHSKCGTGQTYLQAL